MPRQCALLFVFLFLASPAIADMSVSAIADIDLGTWEPSMPDPTTGASSFCVESDTKGGGKGKKQKGKGENPVDYRVRVLPLSSAVFELISTTDPVETIPFRLYFEDLAAPSNEQLNPGIWSTQDKTGETSCNPIVLNAELQVEMDAFDLGQAPAGTYQAQFQFFADGDSVVDDFYMIEVVIPEMAWIQRLDAIGLNYLVGSDAVGDEAFCIWSSTGAYDITISSITPTGSTTFVATGQAVPANTVNYTVLFDSDADASDGAAVTEGATIVNQPTTATGRPASCAADNGAIRVTFTELGNLDSAPADTYQDELTLFIEPF